MYKRQDWDIEWEEGISAFGHVQTMDLDHPGATNQMWNTPKIKALFFGSKAQWVEAQAYVLPLAMANHEDIFFVWADPATNRDAADSFGFSDEDYPTFAMHRTHGDEAMFTLADNDGGKGGVPSKSSVSKMIGAYFAGSLKPQAEEGDEL